MKTIVTAILLTLSLSVFSQSEQNFKSGRKFLTTGRSLILSGLATAAAPIAIANTESSDSTFDPPQMVIYTGVGMLIFATGSGITTEEDRVSKEVELELKELDKTVSGFQETPDIFPNSKPFASVVSGLDCEDCNDLERADLFSYMWLLSEDELSQEDLEESLDDFASEKNVQATLRLAQIKKLI